MSQFVFIPLFLILILGCLLAVYNNILTVKRYKITTEKVSQKMRVVLLADFHNKKYGKNCNRILNKIKRQNPDYIVIAGDTVDRHRPDYNTAKCFVDGAKSIAGTFIITGNHERKLGKENVINKLCCNDILLDEEYKIYKDFSILGLSDLSKEQCQHQRDLLSVFQKLDNLKIIAIHRPLNFDSHLDISSYDVDIVLCGHTHGGVLRIPFFGAIYEHDEGFFPKYSKGIYTKNNTTMIISGGLGNTVLPLRINNFPQIVVIDIDNR